MNIITLLLAVTAAVPTFDAQFTEGSKDCEYTHYSGHSRHEFSVIDGHSAVSYVHVANKKDPKAYDTMWGFKTRNFPVTGGYEGFVKFEQAGKVAMLQRPGGRITWLKADGTPLLYQDALGNMSPITVSLKYPQPAADNRAVAAWTRCQVPPEAKMARIDFAVDAPDIKDGAPVIVRQLAYYEHVRGEPYELDDMEPPELVMLSESPTADFMAPIRFKITDKSGIDAVETKIFLDGKQLAMDQLSREGEAYVYRPSKPWRENSIHEIKVDARDVRGNAGVDNGFVAFTKTELRHPKCTVRDDGMMMMDGTPVFPFGWCRLRPCVGNDFDMDRGVRDMLANGLNTGHTYMSDRDGEVAPELLKEQIGICQRHKLLLYLEPTERKVSKPNFVPLAERKMFNYRELEYPVLWGIGDDTSMNSKPEDIRRYFRLCKAIDPYLLTVSADVAGGSGMYEPYIPNVDITAVETYPIGPEEHAKSMAKVAVDVDNVWKATMAVGRRDRSVFALPQCFQGWGWSRYPTIAEIRCQAYVAAACRVRGIIYYSSTTLKYHMRRPEPGAKLRYSGKNESDPSFGPLDKPEYKEEFFAFSREFGKLLPSLAKRDAAKQPTVRVVKGKSINFLGGESIRCLLKEDGLLIAANTAFEEVTAEITLPNGKVLTHIFPKYGCFSTRY